MFKIYDTQIQQMAIPLMKKLIEETIICLKTDYPQIYEGKSDEQWCLKFNGLFNDYQRFPLKKDENILAYLIMCVRYKTNYEKLNNHPDINSIICNEGFNESEKIYLIDEILYA